MTAKEPILVRAPLAGVIDKFHIQIAVVVVIRGGEDRVVPEDQERSDLARAHLRRQSIDSSRLVFPWPLAP